MPIKSGKQMRLMYAAANNPKGIGGLSQAVAKEFIRETPKKKKTMFSHSDQKEK